MDEDLKQAELENLRQTAKDLGIEFHPNTGAAKLSALIKEAQEGGEENTPEPEVKESKQSRLAKLRAEATKLVRVIVVPNDPSKKEYEGEYFAAGNSLIGTVRQFVPYNNESGWHVQQAILNTLRDKKFQQFVTKKGKHGVESSTPRQVPAFTIVELPPLTKKELAELAASQNARQSV